MRVTRVCERTGVRAKWLADIFESARGRRQYEVSQGFSVISITGEAISTTTSSPAVSGSVVGTKIAPLVPPSVRHVCHSSWLLMRNRKIFMRPETLSRSSVDRDHPLKRSLQTILIASETMRPDILELPSTRLEKTMGTSARLKPARAQA